MTTYKLLQYDITDEEEIENIVPEAFICLNGEFYAATIEGEDKRTLAIDDMTFDKVILFNDQVAYLSTNSIYKQA